MQDCWRQTSAWHQPRQDQVLWRHQTSEPAERRKGTARRSLQHSPRSFRYFPHHPFGCGWHHLQHSHAEAFQGTGPWLWRVKKLTSTLWTSLLNLLIPDVPFSVRYCHQLSSGAGFRPSLQPSQSPLIFPFLFAVEELYGTWYQSGSFSLMNVGSGFHCLRIRVVIIFFRLRS